MNTLDKILDDYYQDRTLDIIKRKSFIAKAGEVVEPAEWHTKAKASLIDYIESLIPEKHVCDGTCSINSREWIIGHKAYKDAESNTIDDMRAKLKGMI
jgi:hypothetical protein